MQQIYLEPIIIMKNYGRSAYLKILVGLILRSLSDCCSMVLVLKLVLKLNCLLKVNSLSNSHDYENIRKCTVLGNRLSSVLKWISSTGTD